VRILWLYFWAVFLAASVACAAPLPPSAFFVHNEGQWNAPFAFRFDGGGGSYFVTSSGLTIDLRQYDKPPRPRDPMDRFRPDHPKEPVSVRGHVLRLSYVGANPNPEIIGEDKLASYSNYFFGRDSCNWKSRVPHFRRVLVKEVWPGIDIEYRIDAKGVETVYFLHPYADPSQIKIKYEGQDGKIRVDANGCLPLSTSLGTVTEAAPFAYQITNHRQTSVICRFEILSDDSYTFSLGAYDPSQEVVIDPLVYSTYFGGGSDAGIRDLERDADGNLLSCGETELTTFPTTPGVYRTVMWGSQDAFWSKFSPDGRNLLFSTFMGGAGSTHPDEAIQVLAAINGNIVVSGDAGAVSFPLTSNAFDSTFGGIYEGFISLFSSDGATLLYSTFVGGSDRDFVNCMAKDSLSGEIYVAGETDAPGSSFPVTPDALCRQTPYNIGFITVLDPVSQTINYSTLFPCTTASVSLSPNYIQVLGNQRIWLTGSVSGALPVTANAYQRNYHGGGDEFFCRLNFRTGDVEYCSYFGGQGQEYGKLHQISDQRVLLYGRTISTDFLVTPDVFDTVANLGFMEGFISILDLPGTLVASTYLGGSIHDGIVCAEIGLGANIIVVGSTSSPDFPVTPNAFDTSLAGLGTDTDDIFICKLSSDLRHLKFGTYLGGNYWDEPDGVLIGPSDSIWIGGVTLSNDYPVTPDAFQSQTMGGRGACFLTHFALHSDTSEASPQISLSMPQSVSLSCYPNPFNPTTTIAFDLPSPSPVRLEVFDVLGRSVWTRDLGLISAGSHRQVWDGEGCASGMYWAKLTAGPRVSTQKLVLVR
jgi:hypothetical protein